MLFNAVSTMQWKPAFILSNQKFNTIWKIRRKKLTSLQIYAEGMLQELSHYSASETATYFQIPKKSVHRFVVSTGKDIFFTWKKDIIYLSKNPSIFLIKEVLLHLYNYSEACMRVKRQNTKLILSLWHFESEYLC